MAPISRYIEPELEKLIVSGLRALVHFEPTTEAERKLANDYADALENDTYLLETTTPPEEVDEDDEAELDQEQAAAELGADRNNQ